MGCFMKWAIDTNHLFNACQPISPTNHTDNPIRYSIMDQSDPAGACQYLILPAADLLVRLSLLLSLASTGQTLYNSVKEREVVVTETQG